jgi:glycosyltransferase involved in cell wall biosynthesis
MTLDGLTLLRFAHAFDSGGGTESYLDDIDRALLNRNAMTIIRMHLTQLGPRRPSEQTSIGRGKLIRIRMPILPETGLRWSSDEQLVRARIKKKLRDWVLYNPMVWNTVGSKWTASFRLSPQAGEAVGAGLAAAEIMNVNPIDLAVLHFFGGADADEVIEQARAHSVPIAVLNHYSNDRFMHLAMRKHAMVADGVAGVNGLQVPPYLKRRFNNLSDGIDTDFFSRANSQAITDRPVEPIILLPARITREKGQLDLLRAAASLRDEGLKCCVVFAGRQDNKAFLEELKNKIADMQLGNSIRFLGAISVNALRDWYAASTAIAFPTYHHEGLPRVIIEAQAMGTPIVAYASGGIPEAITTGTTGLLVTPGDVAGLTIRLKELLSSSELRSSLAAQGRKMAEQRFSLQAMAERHEKFYLRIIANRSRVASSNGI